MEAPATVRLPLMSTLRSTLLLSAMILAGADFADAQQSKANYDEALVGNYTLPEALVSSDGNPVKTADDWTQRRRPEVLKLFQDHVYGRVPAGLGAPAFTVKAVKKDALGGKATRKLVQITLPSCPAWEGIELMLYTPNAATGPVPCFTGLSFGGNHAVSTETDVPLSTRWMRPRKDKGIVDNRATEASRGTESSRWPLAMILDQGFAVATAYYGDIEADHAEGWKTGIRGLTAKNGADTVWQKGDWAAISAWAWGLSRILDYLETDAAVDAKRCAVIGHSRLGKTSLWAGAQDQRFAFVISNNSGEGGAAIMRRNYGETTAVITKAFPHWFTATYNDYADNEAACPVDQHLLIALAAPRPIYIGSAVEDRWADPKGEFLSGFHAGPVYQLFGHPGVGTDQQPGIDSPVGGRIGYHVRSGGHDVKDYDWQQYLAFARKNGL